MAVEFKLDNLGDGVESGDVLEIMVAVGDTVELEQGVIELETDKATVVVPSEFAGKVTKICCAEGDTLKPGDVLMEIESSGDAAPAKEEAEPKKEEPKAEEPAPESKPEPAAESKPGPAPAKQAPAPRQAPVPAEPVKASAAVKPSAPAVSTVPNAGQVAAGPAIRRFAREVGVDLSSVTGSGDNGRIVREDVLKVVRDGSSRSSGAGSAPAIPAGSETDGFGPVRVEKMPKIRQTIARKMHESWTTCPRVTNFDDADVTALEEIRQKSKKEYVDGGVKLTTMPFIVKAVAMALKSHPTINASVDLEAGKIIYKDYVNIGIAVDTERGLVVPNLRNCDQIGIPDIARQLGTLAENVRGNNFSVSDLQGGTFTISNLGAIGGTYSTPIINTP